MSPRVDIVIPTGASLSQGEREAEWRDFVFLTILRRYSYLGIS